MKTVIFLSVCLLVCLYPARVDNAAVLVCSNCSLCFKKCVVLRRLGFVQESGVRATPGAQTAIDKIKAGKEFRYGVFFVKNETVIDLESTGIRLN